MKLIRFFPIIVLIVLAVGCGKKMNPIPKSSLIITSPANVEMQIVHNGIEIINKSDNDTVYVERKETSSGSVGFYSRVAFVKNNSTFIDTEVSKGKKYSYRFRNYYPEYKTYSAPIVQNITYNLTIELKNVNVEVVLNSVCVSADMNDDITYTDIVVNGKFIKKMYREQMTCFNLPSVAFVDLLLIPYNSGGVSGVVYSERIARDERELLLPPQNIKTIRNKGNIVLSWSKGVDIKEYEIYVVKGKEKKLIQKSSATLLKYTLKKQEGCVDFIIYSKRGDFLSEPLNISSCD